MQTASFRKSEPNSRSGDTIPLFLDTNVIAGYCYADIDNWGCAAKLVISSKRPKYTSDTVWKESFGETGSYSTTSNKIIKELRQDINHCKMFIRQGYTDLFSIPPQKGRNENRLLRLLEPYRYELTTEKFLKIADKIIPIVQKTCNERRETIEKNVIIKSRKNPHRDVYHSLQTAYQTNNIEIDLDDFEIIIDAHDIALELDGITFVTGDYNHIVSAQEHITTITAIKSICPLGSLNK